jgi:two-component system cell cycle sensor histidine kinase/response regulator CckA
MSYKSPGADFYQEVVDNLPQTVYESDDKGFLVYVNKWGFQEFGYTEEVLENGFHVLDTLVPEDRDICQKNIQLIIEGKSTGVNEYTALRKDGSTFPVMIYSTPHYRKGRFSGLRGVIVNISVRREKEILLQQSEQRYHNLVELSPNAIIVHQDGIIVFANQAAMDIMGASTYDEILGKPALEYVHPDDRDIAIERIQKVLSNMEEQLPPAEERFRKQDGEYILALVHSIPFIYEGRPAVQVVFNDITQQKRLTNEKEELQNMLYQSQKLEAVGTLAGGIAHDFNNLLTVIIANSELMMRSEDRNYQEDLENILHSAKTAATLTRRLLSFSRKQSHDRENFNGDKVINDMQSILSRLVGENYRINLNMKAPDSYIYASKSELEHILINLVVNSRDAMPDGGDIDISSDEINIEEQEYPSIPPVHQGSFYRIIVQDYGSGMTEEVKTHLFDPFFSTKEQGKGTGLGLSTVYGIMKRNEGGIEIDTHPGVGTCFKLLIPISKQISTSGMKMAMLDHRRSEKKTMLLIEDDLDVRIITRQMLEDHGYMVYSTGDMQEAFALYGRHQEQIDLVIADIRLPDGTGIEMADIIQKQNPELPFLFISGYYHMEKEELVEKNFKREFLSKPFDHLSLIQAISTVMSL